MPELVLIAVCTRRRPQMLAQCLASLRALQWPAAGWTLAAVVVENDDTTQVQALVQDCAATFPFPLSHVQEPQAGLSWVRNRALSEALARNAQWLAFIDDDEQAEPQWIVELCRVARQYAAEVVRGPVHYHYPDADRWAQLRDTGRKSPPAEGQVLKEGATNNVLISQRLFAPTGLGLQFDLRLNFTGGEDKLFFMQAADAGVCMVYAPEARVHETVPLSRCSLQALWRDKARLAANAVRIERDILGLNRDPAPFHRQVRKEVRTALKECGRAGLSLCRRDGNARRHVLKSLLALARVQGLLAGLRGRQLEGYRQVQGH